MVDSCIGFAGLLFCEIVVGLSYVNTPARAD